ncbi:MAG: nascent polypeptide-associated complex protein [Candidatus ainarchaeum sp.]|nr:nascent polypeptide-associated complex protein [Candidatus ainarchaeum sp.]MDD5096477.1 nascent polypeptide-associated complex protein [Candidatus ainarchaeum sp.]
MLGGMDPKQMAKMMKQMGINTKEIPADRVIIEGADEKIIIEEPQIVEITAQGSSSFQISGKVRKEEKVNEEDVALIMEKTGVLREKAIEALKNAKGDLAEAILALQG